MNKFARDFLLFYVILFAGAPLAASIISMIQKDEEDKLESEQHKEIETKIEKKSMPEIKEPPKKKKQPKKKKVEQTAKEKPKSQTFEITAYTAGPESTGKSPGHPEYGITASGSTVEQGRTIAADWNVLPNGTAVEIEGMGRYVVEDKGADIRGNRIDIYFEDLDKALEFGRQNLEVIIIEDGGE